MVEIPPEAEMKTDSDRAWVGLTGSLVLSPPETVGDVRRYAEAIRAYGDQRVAEARQEWESEPDLRTTHPSSPRCTEVRHAPGSDGLVQYPCILPRHSLMTAHRWRDYAIDQRPPERCRVRRLADGRETDEEVIGVVTARCTRHRGHGNEHVWQEVFP